MIVKQIINWAALTHSLAKWFVISLIKSAIVPYNPTSVAAMKAESRDAYSEKCNRASKYRKLKSYHFPFLVYHFKLDFLIEIPLNPYTAFNSNEYIKIEYWKGFDFVQWVGWSVTGIHSLISSLCLHINWFDWLIFSLSSHHHRRFRHHHKYYTTSNILLVIVSSSFITHSLHSTPDCV